VETIHARSSGIPRTISVICDNALIAGFAADRRPVDRAIVLEVCRELDFGPVDPASRAARPPASVASAHASRRPATGTQTAATRAAPYGAHPTGQEETPAAAAGGMFASFRRRRRFSFF
jgi:hypothetical protein